MNSLYTVYRDDETFVLGLNQPVNSDRTVWLFIELIDLWEATGEELGERYCVAIQSASAGFAGKNGCAQARNSWGMSLEEWAKLSDQARAEVLREYGLAATLWQESGSSRRQLLKSAKGKAREIDFLFGFYADRPCNAIGSTGWDFMRGDLFRAISQG